MNLLYGEVQPGDIIAKEIARDTVSDNDRWKSLTGDQGVSAYVR